MNAPGIDRRTLEAVKSREDAAFVEARPRSAALWERAKPVMPNGVPMSWLRTSYDHPPLFVAEGRARGSATSTATSTRTSTSRTCRCSPATRRSRSWRPSPVASRRARSSCCRTRTRSGSPRSWAAATGCRSGSSRSRATHANTEAIRVARALTGRDKVLFFDGKYHGHFDEALVELQDGRLVPEEGGLPRDVTSKTKIVQFNDVGRAARRAGTARRRRSSSRSRR